MIGVGVGIAGQRSAWTPSRVGGYWLRPSRAATGPDASITLASGKVSAASVGGGATLVQATAGNRLTYNAASPANGYASYDSLAGASSSLMSATGGVTGAAPHTLWGVFSHASAGYAGVVTFGPNATSSTIGVVSANGHWGGGNGFGAPLVYGSDDQLIHFFAATYDGTTKTLYVDGERLFQDSAAITFAIGTPTFGLGPALGAMPTARIYSAGWLTRALSNAPGGDLRKLEAWAQKTFALTATPNLGLFGDSQTAGYSAAAPPNNWPTRITALSLLSKPVTKLSTAAVSGYSTQDVIDHYASTIIRGSAFRRNVAVVWCGTNDLSFGNLASDVWTRLQTICAALRANNWQRIVLVTALPRTQAGIPVSYATEAPALNNLIKGSVGTVCDVVYDAAARFPDSNSLTHYQGDKIHLNAAANDIVAAEMAPLINAGL